MKHADKNSMEKAINIVRTLYTHGYEAFFVGGFVRDKLMGIQSYDIDIATSAHPDEIIRLFPNDKVDLVGKSFGVVLINGIEVATYRKDRYFGFSDKNVEISPGTVNTDAARRDFTINSIFFDPFSERIFDPNGGIEDIRNRVIRFVGNPKDRIFEDPNRIIRASRLVSKIDGHFTPETRDALRSYAHFLAAHVASERVRMEILKAMKIDKASRFFMTLSDIGALQYVFPSLEDCHIDGGPHHEEGVFDHCMMVGDALSTKNPLLKLVGYLHDTGKPAAVGTNPDTGVVWFKDHEDVGTEIVQNELAELRFSNEEINYISSLVKLHMRINKSMGPKAVRKLLRELQEVGLPWRDLVRIRLADKVGNLKSSNVDVRVLAKELIKKFWTETRRKNLPLTTKDLAVDGNDVMKALGIGPGPKVGEVLNYLLNFVLEDPDKNDREFLLHMLKITFMSVKWEGKIKF